MENYIDLVKDILENGVDTDSRAGMCRMLTHKTLSYDLSQGFTRVSARFVPFKSVMVELEGFISGITSKKWYQDRGCSYWNSWGNPEVVSGKLPVLGNAIRNKEKLYNTIQESVDDLGAIYPWQWRRHGDNYQPNRGVEGRKMGPNHSYSRCDQLLNVLDKLKDNPDDRRMRVCSVNLKQEHQMALPACHDYWKVDKIGDQLDLFFHMRSWDVFLGGPSNIQFYAVLLHLLSKHANLKPGKLTVFASNVHLYHNLLPQAEELATRESHPLPKLEFDDYGDFWNWDHTKVKCIGYQHSGNLPALVSV